MERLASFISGGGTTMNEIIKAMQSGEIPNMETGLVIASKKSAGGIEKAKALGIPENDIIVLNPKMFGEDPEDEVTKLLFGEAIIAECRRRSIGVITQNGWVKMTPENVIVEYRNRLFNQHPGPVPHFGGIGFIGTTVHDAVIRYWKKITEQPGQQQLWDIASTHMIAQYVYPAYDAGPVVDYTRVPVKPDDTPKTLQERGLPEEHRLQIRLLQQYVAGNLQELVDYPDILVPRSAGLLDEARREALAAA